MQARRLRYKFKHAGETPALPQEIGHSPMIARGLPRPIL